VSRVRENRTHGSMRRGLETERPAMVTAVKRPAGETRGKWLRDLAPVNATAPAPDPTGGRARRAVTAALAAFVILI
jgi:hypothetical protein